MEERNPKGLLALPVELQIQILSYFPFEDQFTATKVCPLWRKIVLYDASIQQIRYSYAPESIILSHRIITWLGAGKPHFTFEVEGPVIKRFTLEMDRFYEEEYEGSLVKAQAHLELAGGDLSELPFLDEPVFPTFEADEGTICLRSKGDDKPGQKLLIMKKEMAVDGERVNGVEYQAGEDIFYETELDDETSDMLTGADYEFNLILNISHNGQWTENKMEAALLPRKETTVREVIEAAVAASDPVLKKWGFDTDQPHEILFIVAQSDVDYTWYLVLGAETSEADVNYINESTCPGFRYRRPRRLSS